MPKLFLALGTNLGNRQANLRRALASLAAQQIKLTALSRIYETEPWGVADQPRFLNMVAAADTALEPHALLRVLKNIERAMGRAATVRYGPRVIDLDILLYDDVVLQTEDLEIPHARLAERRFVLEPLDELAPGRIHPRLGKSVHALRCALPDDGGVQLFPETISLTDVRSNN